MTKINYLAALGAAVVALASFPARAGVGDVVSTNVAPISGQVTYQIAGTSADQPLTTLVAYKVTITRSGTNTVNTAVFKAFASTANAQSSTATNNAAPKFLRAESDASANGGSEVVCTGVDTPSVSCALGTLRAGETRTFGVYFLAPVNLQGRALGDEVVKFSAYTDYSEGLADASTRNDRSDAGTIADVLLGTPNPTVVKSALSRQGGSFYTGANGVALSDLTTTKRNAAKLDVPATANALLTSATIELARDATTACGNSIACHTANITIPQLDFTTANSTDKSKYLTITIRIDTQDVGNGFRTSGVTVFYENELNALPRCTYVTVGGVSRPDLSQSSPRCVGPVTQYGNSAQLGDFRRDVEVIVYSLSNGGYKVLP